jgi:DNA-binding LacI/PurR family transcriptional regulator
LKWTNLPLTSVRQPHTAKGRAAAMALAVERVERAMRTRRWALY